MSNAPTVVGAFSPLDEELQLQPGRLTPTLQEQAVRISAWMPFGRAASEFEWFTHVPASEFAVRQLGEGAGRAYVELQTAEVEHLERTAPEPPQGPERQLLSVDGAMVPLTGGAWAEVKTLVVGQVEEPVWENGEWVVHTTHLSYFSRMAEAGEFGRLSTVETHRRGLERARQVCAVTDGAVWEQGFIDLHRPDAVRILDFPHAAEHVTLAGEVAYGEGTAALEAWQAETLHELKHGSPDTVLQNLRTLHQEARGRGVGQAQVMGDTVQYLEKRRAQIAYAEFQAQGYPIGSGAVESGNKVVVEARLKGAGMHWAGENVNPMLALRNIVCNDRWAEAWPQIEAYRRAQVRAAQERRRQQRRLKRQSIAEQPPSSRLEATRPRLRTAPVSLGATEPIPQPPQGRGHRPAENHPWRHSPIGRAVFLPRKKPAVAKN